MVSVIWCARRHLKVQIVGLEVRGKNAWGTHERWHHRFACTPRCLCVVGRRLFRPSWAPLRWGHGAGFVLAFDPDPGLLAVLLILTASELELARCAARRRPKPERACAAAAVRSCVRRGLPSCSWRLATLLKCQAVSRTAYIFPEGHSLPATD